MKKVSQLMQDLGFKKDGSNAVKEAFIKNLIKATSGMHIATPTEKKMMSESLETIVELRGQLSFDFETEEAPLIKKSGA